MTCPTSTATPAASNASTPLARWSPDRRLRNSLCTGWIPTEPQLTLQLHLTLCYTFLANKQNPHVRQGAESHGSHAEVQHGHGSTELSVEALTPPPSRGCDDPVICLCRCVDLHRGQPPAFTHQSPKKLLETDTPSSEIIPVCLTLLSLYLSRIYYCTTTSSQQANINIWGMMAT